jgi:hypothetical protein
MKNQFEKESENNALIFIPDISGFTKFVNETEIKHSQHIIQELLEVIIGANRIQLSVSEIEGDAILFYRSGNPPKPKELADQTKRMFIDFHHHLQTIERDRVCQCGACRTAIKLTLKFLVHYGEIRLTQIQNHTKLMGKDVILAHRLLKNNVDSDEYILLTESYNELHNSHVLEKSFSWAVVNSGVMNYEHIGDVHFNYIILSELRKSLPALPTIMPSEKYPNPIQVLIDIVAPIHFVYSIIIDLSERINWTHGLNNIQFNEDEIPKLGSKHICDLPTGLVELQTIKVKSEEDRFEYAERATKNKLIKNATTFFMMEAVEFGTHLTIEFHYQKFKLIGWLIDLILRSKVNNSIIQSSKNLKKYCEEKYSSLKQHA